MEEIIDYIITYQKKHFKSVYFKIYDSGEIEVRDYSDIPLGCFDSLDELRTHLNE